jgi:hypothetical protein
MNKKIQNVYSNTLHDNIEIILEKKSSKYHLQYLFNISKHTVYVCGRVEFNPAIIIFHK